MRLSDAENARLLPQGMPDRPYDEAFTKAFDRAEQAGYDACRLLTIWDHVDELPEELLDLLADTLHIEWYETGAPIETKRELVRTSDAIHAKKGTVEAVESVIRAYFGDGYLMEWFDYGGLPHHFKVFTTNPDAVAERQALFEDMLSKVKRRSSKLDSILIGLTGDETVHVGVFNHSFNYMEVATAEDANHVFGSAATVMRGHVLVTVDGS